MYIPTAAIDGFVDHRSHFNLPSRRLGRNQIFNQEGPRILINFTNAYIIRNGDFTFEFQNLLSLSFVIIIINLKLFTTLIARYITKKSRIEYLAPNKYSMSSIQPYSQAFGLRASGLMPPIPTTSEELIPGGFWLITVIDG